MGQVVNRYKDLKLDIYGNEIVDPSTGEVHDLANDSLPAFGQVYALTQVMWVAIIGYHIAIGAASGLTAYANIGITAVLGFLFFYYSKK